MNFGFIGTGHMGAALVRAMAKSTSQIIVCDHNPEKVQRLASSVGVAVLPAQLIAQKCDCIVLGVKPQVMAEAIEEIKPVLQKRREEKKPFLLVSMAAGTTIESLYEMLGFTCPLIRIMPNTPVAVGEGMIPYASCGIDESEITESFQIGFLKAMSGAGVMLSVKEDQMDAVTALSGSGPAFCYRFIEAMAQGGVTCGLSYNDALLMAAQTVRGSARLVQVSSESPEELCQAVCSPGGTTIEGVKVLSESSFNDEVRETVRASYKRSVELGKKE